MQVKELWVGGVRLPTNVLMAPLAGYTCYPFRTLCYRLGAGLCFTEMAGANSLQYRDRATRQLLISGPGEPLKAAQLLGADPRVMEKMACSEYFASFDILDINMGCPVPNVFKSGAGSALMGDFRRAAAIIRGCKKSGKPVSVKCRIGIREDNPVAAEFARMCEDAGADMIAIHGRSRSMMYDGAPYLDQIEQAKAAVRIPVIANGGIATAQDAERTLRETGADGIMLARTALENPFLFSELTGKPCAADRYAVLCGQMDMAMQYYGETYTLTYIKRIAAYFMKRRRDTKRYQPALHRSGNLAELRAVIWAIFAEKEADPI